MDVSTDTFLLTSRFKKKQWNIWNNFSYICNPFSNLLHFLISAPEILNYEPISLGTDVWSLGILAYVLLSGHSPFAGDTKQETFCNISQCNLDFPDDLFGSVSQTAKDFINATLVPEPG